MKTIRKLQKGIMMIEVVAVLGLLAAITPMLFQQISRRNDDILNVQVATEMRAVKEALSAYIQANESAIAKDCELIDDDGKYKNIPKGDDGGEPCEILDGADLIDYFSGDSGILNDYKLVVNVYTIPTQVSGSNITYRPFIYGLVGQASDGDVAPQGLKNASKIASLIGLDGGVVVDGVVNGIQGSWHLLANLVDEDDNSVARFPDNTVVAVTAFDTQTNSAILKDVKLEHFKGSTMQTDQAMADRIALREVLSVGDTNCIAGKGNDNLSILKTGEKIDASHLACAPLFEVDSNTGKVTVQNGILEVNSNVGYTATITKGNWTPDTIEEGKYNFNLTGTSTMHDIKLTALGGAKLSEVIPDWILKGTEEVVCSTVSGVTISISGISCPKGYHTGIVLIPTAFETSVGQNGGTITLDNVKLPFKVLEGNGQDTAIQFSCKNETGDTGGDVQTIKKLLVQKYCIKSGKFGRTATCPANTYFDAEDEKCIPCPAGTTSQAGSTSAEACTSGS